MASKKNVMNEVLIWLGAGQIEAPSLNFDKFDEVVLVEARLEQVAALRKRFSNNDKVKIIHGVVSDKAQKSDFSRYSLGEYSALSSASGLKELFPGLELIELEKVETQCATDILSEFAEKSVSITLVLDVLDLNHLILKSIIDSECWQKINDIYLPIPDLSLYEDAATVSDFLTLLKSQGFELVETDIADPDIPIAQLNRNPLWFELESLRKQFQLQNTQHQKVIDEYESKLQAQNDDAEKAKMSFTQSFEKQSSELKEIVENNDRLKSELEESNQQKTELLESLERRLESDKLASEAKIKELQTDKQQLIEKLGRAKDENDMQHQKLRSEIQAVTSQVEQKTTKIEHLHSSLETQKAESTKQFETLQAEKQQVASNLEQLKINFSTLELEHKQQLEESSQAKQSFESEKSSLESELSSLKIELEKRTKQRDEQAHWHEENKKWAEGLNKKVESLEVSLKASNESLKTVQTEKQQLETKVDELNTKISGLETEHKQQFDDSLQVKQTLQSEKSALESELSSLRNELEERTKQRDEQTHWHQENKKWAENLDKKAKSLDASLGETRENLNTAFKTVALNTKLMTKLELDNNALRRQLSDKSKSEKQLKGLISELHDKLKLASVLYHKIQEHNPELLNKEY
ncbi:hypothetical protein [Alteromonas sp. M12]|uniref:hypothetical protein n=1 Tax=Alteromonas sp. M12 TaxID=3135644 RepID=UPI00319E10A4